jgi:ComEC/Rec2-related protein
LTRVNDTWQMGLGLAALIAPPGFGLAAPLLALALRAGPLVVLALLCCALVPCVAPQPAGGAPRAGVAASSGADTAEIARNADAEGDAVLADDDDAGAREYRGRWREPPGAPAFLETDGGDLALRFPGGVLPPPPGTPVIVHARLSASGGARVVTLQTTGPPSGAWLDRWTAAAAARVKLLVARDRQGIVAALLIGQRQDVPFPVTADWARLGVSHMLALSGQNVTLLVACWERAGLGQSVWVTALVVAGFVLVAGSGAPLVRSALGFGFLAVGRRTARRSAGLRRLLAVALLMEAWEPGLHAQLSAQLSFLAVAGLIAASGVLPAPFGLLLSPCGAFLATAPICAETFGRLAPVGLLVTPLLVPLVTVILCLGLIAVLPGALFAVFDRITGPLLDGTADALLRLTAWLARHAPEPLTPPAPPLPGWLFSLAIIAALIALAHLRRSSRSSLQLADFVP